MDADGRNECGWTEWMRMKKDGLITDVMRAGFVQARERR
jgi:hypothetical protein